MLAPADILGDMPLVGIRGQTGLMNERITPQGTLKIFLVWPLLSCVIWTAVVISLFFIDKF